VAPAARGSALRASVTGGVQSGYGDGLDPYARAEASWSLSRSTAGGLLTHRVRLFGGVELDAPAERGLYLSARTPTETFANHWWRPDGGVLSGNDVPYRPLGGGGLRGYDALASTRALGAL